MKASSLGLREIRVSFGMFDFTMICLVGPDTHVPKFAAWKYDDKRIGELNLSANRGFCFMRTGYCPIVWIPEAPTTPRQYAVLAHEILHAVSHMLRDWVDEIPHTRDTEEVYCHAQAHAITVVLTALQQKKRLTRRRRPA